MPPLSFWPTVAKPTLAHLGALVAAALAVAMAVSHLGSPSLGPGESLLWPAILVLAGLGWSLERSLARRGLTGDAGLTKARVVVVLGFMIVASPLVGLVIMPAINGLAGTSEAQTQTMTLQKLSSHRSARSVRIHWFAELRPDAPHALRAGRYFLGGYNTAWQPHGESPRPGSTVLVEYRRGLLGATTVLSAIPVTAPPTR